jgi:hypothetical protein
LGVRVIVQDHLSASRVRFGKQHEIGWAGGLAIEAAMDVLNRGGNDAGSNVSPDVAEGFGLIKLQPFGQLLAADRVQQFGDGPTQG